MKVFWIFERKRKTSIKFSNSDKLASCLNRAKAKLTELVQPSELFNIIFLKQIIGTFFLNILKTYFYVILFIYLSDTVLMYKGM